MRRRPIRRRPMRPRARFPRPFAVPVPVRGNIPPKLQEANRLYKQGEYSKAAKRFEELADKAEQRNHPQAPRLFIQAGFSWLKSEKFDKGEKQIKKGFSLLIERKKWAALRKTSSATFTRMEFEGFNTQKESLEKWLEEQVPQEVKEAEVWQRSEVGMHADRKIKLPATCPQCGAPINPKEVEWYQNEIAQCPFCNSIVNGD